MITLSQIIRQRKDLTFEFGNDEQGIETMVVVYEPFKLKGQDYRRYMEAVENVDKRRLFKRRKSAAEVYRGFLTETLISWDITDEEGKAISVEKGLEILPDVFIGQLFYSILNDMQQDNRELLSEPLKKR